MQAEEQTSKVCGWLKDKKQVAPRREPHVSMAMTACWPGLRGLRLMDDAFLWQREHRDTKDDYRVAGDQKGRR